MTSEQPILHVDGKANEPDRNAEDIVLNVTKTH